MAQGSTKGVPILVSPLLVGAADTNVPSTLAIKTYVDALSTLVASDYVPKTRAITINGSTQTLAADRTWTIATTGTLNRISVSGGTGLTPTIDIDAAYVGQASITTLGTITTGTWNGSLIGLAYGGTNKNMTAVNGGVVYTDADSMEVTAAGSAGQILRSAGAAAPVWSTPTFPNTATSGKVLQGDGTNIVLSAFTLPTAVGATGTILRSDGTNYVATTATYPTTITANQILYATGSNAIGSSADLTYNGSGDMYLIKNQNNYTRFYVQNSTNDTTAYSELQVSGSAIQTRLIATPALFTPSGIYTASSSILSSGFATNFNIGTIGATPVNFYTNNTKMAVLDATASTTAKLTLGTGGVGTLHAYYVTDGGTTGLSGYYIARNTSTVSTFAISNGASAIINGSVTGDLGIRNSQKIMFSADAGVTAHLSLLTTGEFGIGMTPAQILDITKNQNALTEGKILNSNAGAAAYTAWELNNGTSAGFIAHYGTGYTTSGTLQANSTALNGSGANGVSINAYNASGVIKFGTGASFTERARFLNTGEFIWGATALAGTEIACFRKDQNAITEFRLSNSTSGTASYCAYTTASSSYTGYYLTTSAGFTTSGALTANMTAVGTNATGGLLLYTNVANAPVIISTGLNVEKARVLSTGEFIVGANALVSTEFMLVRKNQNGATGLYVYNSTSGTASQSYFRAGGDTCDIYMATQNSSYTTSGLRVADQGYILTNTASAGLLIGNISSAPIQFCANGTAAADLSLHISSVNNVSIGGSAVRGTTVGTKALQIFDGTAPAGTLANGCSFYSTAGEMRVMDAAGNATLLSPHEKGTNYWIYDSVDTTTGKRLKIDMEQFMKWLNEKFGTNFVHEYTQTNN